MRLTAITCTTPERKDAFDLCKGYMDRQSRKADQWLVLDGPEPMQQKLKQAIFDGRIEGDYIVFAEDDDWFAPTWFEWCERNLAKGFDIVGQGNALYYNVAHRWWSNCHNVRHASLCQTAISKKMLLQLWRIIDDFDCPWVDVQLWGIDGRKYLHLPTEGEMLLVGIKGFFEKGYSREHRQVSGADNEIDYDLSKLRSLIGPDCENYRHLFHGEAELLALAGAL